MSLFVIMALAAQATSAPSSPPSHAQPKAPVEAWRSSGDNVLAVPSGISFPARAGPTTVYRTREISSPVEAVDNVATYHTPDDAIEVSAYVYLAALADAALAADLTKKAVRMRFGEATALASERASRPAACLGLRFGTFSPARAHPAARSARRRRSSPPRAGS